MRMRQRRKKRVHVMKMEGPHWSPSFIFGEPPTAAPFALFSNGDFDAVGVICHIHYSPLTFGEAATEPMRRAH
jgi:hypothetical protein